jgi:hypothetical protein
METIAALDVALELASRFSLDGRPGHALEVAQLKALTAVGVVLQAGLVEFEMGERVQRDVP